ncbi:MAG TPA: hypothetical protein VE131_16195 [Terriglobales bacterium]|nr:hypothetical protein [Terriglobales bacterium]
MIEATFWLYGIATRQACESVAKNWIVSLAPLAYGMIMTAAGSLAVFFGILGGFLLAIASQACLSSALYLIENIVRIGKTNFDDFVKGFGVYLWELLLIAFIIWIPLRLASVALAGTPNGWLIFALIQIGLYILLNPLPEFIYQTRTSGLDLISASYQFVVENWLEWFLPNILLTVAGYFVFEGLGVLVYGIPGFLQFFVLAFGFGLYLTYFMVFRGFLFGELHGTTRRGRVFRYNARHSA